MSTHGDDLLERLCRLTPAQFEVVLHRLGVNRAHLLPAEAERARRAVQLLEHCRNQDISLSALSALVTTVVGLPVVEEAEGAAGPGLIPDDLVRELAREYPDASRARGLWERAGGDGGDVESLPHPRDLWQRLWMRSVRGAAARPVALLRAALDDLPSNRVFQIHLRRLSEQASAPRVLSDTEE